MGDVDYTAADVLTEHGFGNIIEHNYTSADCGAHTIAYRDIAFINTENTQNTNAKGDDNNVSTGNLESDLLYNKGYNRNSGDDSLYIDSGSEGVAQLTYLATNH